ncbi:hypothetical protein IPV09_10905 [Tessaracoccus sp. SD287]|uniref:hypothetical protein n=1 Tax=Tessaracoccus sp. SD287 TaxID=2782008 RepID=UPI001A95DF1D|nr:hypothetical protein [Tessaracoccus sp. SD287]MBO1031843.1 hypothetical protein [Tessaracoccus sp. SD287]
MGTEAQAELHDVIADTYRALVADQTEVTALGCLLGGGDATTATLSVQTGVHEVRAMLARGAEHIVEDEGALLEMRWNPRAHQRHDATTLPEALATVGLSGDDAVEAVLAALQYLVEEGTLDEVAPGGVRAVLINGDTDRDTTSDLVAALNNPVRAAEWEEAYERFRDDLDDL